MVLKRLEDGLIIRRGRRSDAAAIQAFYAKVLRDPDEPGGSANPVGRWARDLFAGRHPTTGPANFTVVEDGRSGRIVSALGLIPQTWAYDGVEFPVGQIELVATERAYRNRGLVRAQMQLIHRRSRRLGHLVQVIEGIPYFYRQFGYEMCLPLFGFRAGAAASLPRPGSARRRGEPETPYRLRPALEGDVPFLGAVYDRARRRSLVSAVWDEAVWRYKLAGRDPAGAAALEWRIIEDAAGRPAGYMAHSPRLEGSALVVSHLELIEGEPWLSAMPSVLRYVREAGERCAAASGTPFGLFRFVLGESHPAYDAASAVMPVSRPPYAWYVRVADLPAFIRHIALALEGRLASSGAAGYSGELKLSFYRDGLRIAFEAGRVARVGRWPRPLDAGADARFPDGSFLQLLFGRRSLDEVVDWYADCSCSGRDERARVLLGALLPRRPSHTYSVG